MDIEHLKIHRSAGETIFQWLNSSTIKNVLETLKSHGQVVRMTEAFHSISAGVQVQTSAGQIRACISNTLAVTRHSFLRNDLTLGLDYANGRFKRESRIITSLPTFNYGLAHSGTTRGDQGSVRILDDEPDPILGQAYSYTRIPNRRL